MDEMKLQFTISAWAFSTVSGCSAGTKASLMALHHLLLLQLLNGLDKYSKCMTSSVFTVEPSDAPVMRHGPGEL